MFDRFFMPALTFTLLAAALAAFVADIAQGQIVSPQVTQRERVQISARRELQPTPLAQADADRSTAAVVAR
jgi:hypothetical protein